MIHYVTAWITGNSGKAWNDAISLLPDDAIVCLRDGDSMFLNPQWGIQVEAIAKRLDSFDVIGCVTNRLNIKNQLYAGHFSYNSSITEHIGRAIDTASKYGMATVVETDGPVAGLFMLFKKSVWKRVGKFEENSMYLDLNFCHKVLMNGHYGRIGIARGLYVFHLYRWGTEYPQNRTEHLLAFGNHD